MGNVGRYFCVALPFILTVGSIIAALIVGLAGVSNHDLYLFEVDITNLTIDATQLQNFINNASAIASGQALDDIKKDLGDKVDDISDKVDEAGNDASNKVKDIVDRTVEWSESLFARDEASDAINAVTGGQNITAADLGLADKYQFTLWGYCRIPQDGKKNCTQAQFDWASKELNLDFLTRIKDLAHLDIKLPKQLNDGLTAYKTLNKWTEVVFIIAIVALALELIVGLFTACSRAVSCVTWIIAGLASAAMITAASLLTVTGSVFVSVVVVAASHYGAKAHLNANFLAAAWISVAFALGASLFWLFSVCCCKPENRPYVGKKARYADTEKSYPAGSYAPIGENHHNNNNAYGGYNYGVPQRGGARTDLAYEPYSHSRV
ncbi:SUR7 protein [Astrocystis sublimbata]|nr:SUR7 protein [Astrocystis sublimbata]